MFTPEDIISIQTRKEFHKIAMKVYRYQYENNLVYREFCDLIRKTPTEVRSLDQVPFLPIEFFKSKSVLSSTEPIQTTFTSSGTTGVITSKHHVTDLNYYQESFRKGFAYFYGPIEDYVVLALLPSYLEREGSSLIYMAEDFIKQSNHPESGFYLHNYEELIENLKNLDKQGKSVLLLGVTYALLDILEQHTFELKNTIIMETGGMKGSEKK